MGDSAVDAFTNRHMIGGGCWALEKAIMTIPEAANLDADKFRKRDKMLELAYKASSWLTAPFIILVVLLLAKV